MRRIAAAPVQDDLPAARLFAVMRRRDAAVELDIATQVQFVGHVVKVPLGLGLRREVFVPVPLLEQFLRERVAVGPALQVKTRAGIAIPVPGAAYPARARHPDKFQGPRRSSTRLKEKAGSTMLEL